MKSVVKVMRKPLRAVCQKQPFTQYVIRKILEKKPTTAKTADIEPAAFLEISSLPSFLKYTLNRMTILGKTLEWPLPNIPFTTKVKIIVTKFAYICR